MTRQTLGRQSRCGWVIIFILSCVGLHTGSAHGQPFAYIQPGFNAEYYGFSSNFMGSIGFAPDGDPWVTRCVFSSQARRFDGQSTVSINGYTVHPEGTATGTNFGCGLTTHSDGSLYSNTGDGVTHQDGESGAPAVPPGPGPDPDGDRYGIAAHPAGEVYGNGEIAYATKISAPSLGHIYKVDAALTTTTLVSTATEGELVTGLTFEPTGTYLFAAIPGSSRVSVIKYSDGTEVEDVALSSSPVDVCFYSAGPSFLVTNHLDGTLSRLDFNGPNGFEDPPDVSLFASGPPNAVGTDCEIGHDGAIYVTQNFIHDDDKNSAGVSAPSGGNGIPGSEGGRDLPSGSPPIALGAGNNNAVVRIGGVAQMAVNTTAEGSILVWPHVQLSWLPGVGGGADTIFTDTIITLVNNSTASVRIKFLIWNGDCQIPDFGTGATGPIERGCNFIDRSLTLTPFEPLYWSAFTGTKRNRLGSADAAFGPGIFTHLNTGITFRPLDSDGRPDTELDPTGAIGIRRIRGFLVGIATSAGPNPAVGNPICHDHLSGTGTVINYSRTSAFQYKAYAYDCIAEPAPVALNQLQVIPFNGVNYQANWEKLLARFFAFNEPFPFVPPGSPTVGPSAAYARNLAVTPNLRNTEINGRLSLLPIMIDASNPSGNLNSQFRTEVVYDIFNENETGFTGAQKCICCWDSALFENYAQGAHPGAPFPFSSPENFRATILGTDFGMALIDAPGPGVLGFDNCRRLPTVNGAGISDPGSNPSSAAPLLGIQTTVSRWGSESFSEDGSELTGVGEFDLTGLLTYRVTAAQSQDEGQGDVTDPAPLPTPAPEVKKKRQ